ncbi:MAG TPA: hypothetical protein VIV14_03420, partial [Gammaproteobacteria bacterium]
MAGSLVAFRDDGRLELLVVKDDLSFLEAQASVRRPADRQRETLMLAAWCSIPKRSDVVALADREPVPDDAGPNLRTQSTTTLSPVVSTTS